MHEAGYVDYLEHLVPLLKLDINILSILHNLGSPLGFCTLIFYLMRNLYNYNACIYIHSILLDVLGILSSAIDIKVLEKYVILSTVSFASDFNFKIHEFLNSSHFALLRFHRGIVSPSSGPEISKMIGK